MFTISKITYSCNSRRGSIGSADVPGSTEDRD